MRFDSSMLQSHICTRHAHKCTWLAHTCSRACTRAIASQSHLTISTLKIIVAQSLYSILFFLWSTNRAQTARSHRHEAVYTLFFFLFPLSRLTSRDGGVHDAIKFDSRAERGAICCLYSRRVRYRDTP
ncbi:hypothetical protein CAJAP_08052 [Camponotus japonicus]